jgi:hypothetical protein
MTRDGVQLSDTVSICKVEVGRYADRWIVVTRVDSYF